MSHEPWVMSHESWTMGHESWSTSQHNIFCQLERHAHAALSFADHLFTFLCCVCVCLWHSVVHNVCNQLERRQQVLLYIPCESVISRAHAHTQMYVLLHICVYIYIHIYIYTYMYVYIHTYIFVYVCIYTYIYIIHTCRFYRESYI